MNEFDGALIREEFSFGANVDRHRVVKRGQAVKHDADRLANLPAGDGCRGRVERDRRLRPGERCVVGAVVVGPGVRVILVGR